MARQPELQSYDSIRDGWNLQKLWDLVGLEYLTIQINMVDNTNSFQDFHFHVEMLL